MQMWILAANRADTSALFLHWSFRFAEFSALMTGHFVRHNFVSTPSRFVVP